MIIPLSKAYISITVGASLLILLITGTNFCSDIEISERVYFQEPEPIERVNFQESEPIKVDFEELQDRGTLRMITRYSPESYFLMGGMDHGFEYDLVSRFARENGLKVEVVLIGSHEDPLEILESGEGDLIADHFVINKELLDQVTYSKPYNYINQVYNISKGEIENVLMLKLTDEEIWDSKTHQEKAAGSYPGKRIPEMSVTKTDSIAWAIRKNSPVLKQKIDEFIGAHIQVRESDGSILRSAYLNNLRLRYFKRDRLTSRYQYRAFIAIYTGYLSPYDDIVKSISDEAGIDWKLVIAVMAQESAFNPEAESLAGALGLMQIIPRFSEVANETMLYDPEINIREGVRYLKKHLNREAHLDSLNQHSMALAAYNVGSGNLADARELAVQLGNDPDDWPNIADALLKLMDPYYYEHSRHGYKKGTETVNYVEDVLRRYTRYQVIYMMAALFEEGDEQELIVLNR